MKLFSIKSVASRGWATLFISIFLTIIALLMISNHMFLGGILINGSIVVFPIGIYEIIRGRTKYKGMTLEQYKKIFNDGNESKIYTGLTLLGSFIAGWINGYIDISS